MSDEVETCLWTARSMRAYRFSRWADREGQQVKRVTWGAVALSCVVGRLVGVAAAALTALVAVTAQAQLSCTPAAPRTDPGAGFVPFGAAEQLVARGGNAGSAWEWAIGTDTEGSQSAKGSLDWVSGKLYAWTLSYSGAGAATIEVRDAGNLVLSRTWALGMDTGNALQVQVSTNPSIGPGTTMAASVSSINGHSLSGAVSQTGNNTQAEQNLYYFFPPMASGFTATGTVSLTYGSLPAGARVQFLARAGTIACSGGNAAPTVSITSPAANATFTAPASITLTANAQDTDGTVTQVQYFANASPIGTATASPYSFNWTNVAAGTYSLTAVATDNVGATTTSAPVPITVGAAQAKLYFIHTDHLNTPRLIADDQQRTVWRWDNTDPFGGNPPDENPSGLGVFEFPLRFPGQYFDPETGAAQNGHRDYWREIGRYQQFDPIGLRGGVNGFAYVGSNPLSYADPTGQDPRGIWINGTPSVASGTLTNPGASFMSPRFDPFGYLQVVRVSGTVGGVVQVSVKCVDDDLCTQQSWEMHRAYPLSVSGSTGVVPNLYATAIGIRFGPWAALGANVVLATGKIGYSAYQLYSRYGTIGSLAVSALLGYGPDYICTSGFPDISGVPQWP
jgi:RHS repeat-associated protein